MVGQKCSDTGWRLCHPRHVDIHRLLRHIVQHDTHHERSAVCQRCVSADALYLDRRKKGAVERGHTRRVKATHGVALAPRQRAAGPGGVGGRRYLLRALLGRRWQRALRGSERARCQRRCAGNERRGRRAGDAPHVAGRRLQHMRGKHVALQRKPREAQVHRAVPLRRTRAVRACRGTLRRASHRDARLALRLPRGQRACCLARLGLQALEPHGIQQVVLAVWAKHNRKAACVAMREELDNGLHEPVRVRGNAEGIACFATHRRADVNAERVHMERIGSGSLELDAHEHARLAVVARKQTIQRTHPRKDRRAHLRRERRATRQHKHARRGQRADVARPRMLVCRGVCGLVWQRRLARQRRALGAWYRCPDRSAIC